MRTSKELSLRVDLDAPKQPSRLRYWTWVAAWIALAAPLVLGALLWAAGERRPFHAAPVSSAHRVWENDCHKCHVQPFAAGARLFTSNHDWLSTPNRACESCHAGPPHHARQLPGIVDQCAECHREHRGGELLSRVDDSLCVQCHADLQTVDTHFQFVGRKQIHAFDSHPQFAMWEPPRADDARDDGLFRWRRDEAPAEPKDDKSGFRDRGTIAFNHKLHLSPEGVASRPGGERAVLKCADCHEADGDGRYMRPISFEAHCRDCHEQQLSLSPQRPDDAPPFDALLPHRDVEAVRGVLRQRLTEYAVTNWTKLSSGERPADDKAKRPEGDGENRPLPRFFPGQESPPAVSKEVEAWVREQMNIAEGKLFRPSPETRDFKFVDAGCAYCHQVTLDEKGTTRVAPPRIADRWFTLSRFRHDSHPERLIACDKCHAGVRESAPTSDILMPKIETCRACHVSGNKATSARSACVTCHDYHHAPDRAPGWKVVEAKSVEGNSVDEKAIEEKSVDEKYVYPPGDQPATGAGAP